jgi:probable O-glycosylation ligase (exosortase A-associated)
MRDAVFLAFLVAYVPIIMRYPPAGAMVWAWLAFFSPDQYMYSFMTNMPLEKVIVIITFVAMLLSPGRKRLYLDGIIVLMVAFLLQGLISASLSLTLNPINWQIYSKVAKIMVLAIVVTVLMTNRRRLHVLAVAIVLGVDISAVLEGLKFIVSGGGHHVMGLVTMGDNNQFALAMLMALPMTFYLRNTSRNRYVRWALGGTLGLIVAAVIGTYSRGGFVGLVLITLLLILMNRHRARNLLIAVALSGVVMVAAPDTWFERISSIQDARAGQDNSFNGRLVAWHVSTAIAYDRPFYGAGFHALQDPHVWTSYARSLADDESGFLASGDLFARAAHSIYFEVLGDQGFTGLILFVALLLAGLNACRQIIKITRHERDLAWARQFATMMLISLIVYAVSGAALSMAYFELFYLQLAMISATRRLVRRELARRAIFTRQYEPIAAPWEEPSAGIAA